MLLWSGEGVGGVRMMVEELCEEVVEVKRVSNGVMAIVFVFEEDVLMLICGYAPQCGQSLDDEQSFYYELRCKWDIHSVDDIVVCLGGLNGYVGRYIDEFDAVHCA